MYRTRSQRSRAPRSTRKSTITTTSCKIKWRRVYSRKQIKWAFSKLKIWYQRELIMLLHSTKLKQKYRRKGKLTRALHNSNKRKVPRRDLNSTRMTSSIIKLLTTNAISWRLIRRANQLMRSNIIKWYRSWASCAVTLYGTTSRRIKTVRSK